MQIKNFTQLRNNLAKIIDDSYNNNEQIIITKNDKSVVMISLKEFNAWKETMYLLKSPANIKRLQESLKNVYEGNFRIQTLIEDNDKDS